MVLPDFACPVCINTLFYAVFATIWPAHLERSLSNHSGLCLFERSFNLLGHIAPKFRIPVSDAG